MSEEPHSWPAGRSFPAEQAISTTCESCSTPWRVHENLAGYRFSCDVCNAWVRVPQPEQPTLLQIEAARALEVSRVDSDHPHLDLALRPIDELPTDADGLVEIDLPSGVVYQGKIPSSAALAPGSLAHVRVEEQQRWTNRTILEVGAMVFAILLPFAASEFFFTEDEAAVLMPLSALIGGVLVVLIGLSAPRYTFGGLRRAPLRYFLEAVGVTALVAVCAFGWIELVTDIHEIGAEIDDQFTALRERLGLVLLVGVVAVAPAIFEEIAFRGLLQGRLTALMGRFAGIFTTAILFAFAHGIGLGSPIHVVIGIYLGYLRVRCGSLLPGMLLHFLYNATVVLVMSS